MSDLARLYPSNERVSKSRGAIRRERLQIIMR
jgi:hypothetical protein